MSTMKMSHKKIIENIFEHKIAIFVPLGRITVWKDVRLRLVFATSSAIFGRSANVENERVTRIKSLEIDLTYYVERGCKAD